MKLTLECGRFSLFIGIGRWYAVHSDRFFGSGFRVRIGHRSWSRGLKEIPHQQVWGSGEH